jgi:hypothetical protein
MAGMKVTLDAALRARDVSRPTPGQEAQAERELPERLAGRRPGPTPPETPGSQPVDGTASKPRPPRPTRPPGTPAGRADTPAAATVEQPSGRPRPHPPRARRRSRLQHRAGPGDVPADGAYDGSGGSSPDCS